MKNHLRTAASVSLIMLATASLAGCAIDQAIHDATGAKAPAIDPRVPMSTVTAMDAIAKQHDGNRAVGTSGGTASGDAIIATLEGLGLDPKIEEFALKDPDGNDTEVTGRNIIVDLNTGSSDEVVLLGTHYDSVDEGPGIVDNASGVATLLAAAASHDDSSTWDKTVRLAFWDAEEASSTRGGIQGSAAYVDALSDAEAAKITGYVNYDMTATKDGRLLLIDSDRSSLAELPADIASGFAALPPIADGATEFEARFAAPLPADANTKQDAVIGLATDSAPFIVRGITVSGVSVVSAEETLTENNELEFIPCYHKKCDDLSQVDETMLSMIADHAIALLPALAK